MYHFRGELRDEGSQVNFDHDNFVQSGASLKNTEWVLGLVVYTG